MNNFIIKKEEFDCLYDKNVNKDIKQEIIEKINLRFSEICNHIIIKTDINRAWFDYGNVIPNNGYFDIKEYKKKIDVNGEHFKFIKGCPNYIPTKWLWQENYLEQIEKRILRKKYFKKVNNYISKNLKIKLILEKDLSNTILYSKFKKLIFRKISNKIRKVINENSNLPR